jgi:hypothetical protein
MVATGAHSFLQIPVSLLRPAKMKVNFAQKTYQGIQKKRRPWQKVQLESFFQKPTTTVSVAHYRQNIRRRKETFIIEGMALRSQIRVRGKSHRLYRIRVCGFKC